MSAIIKKAIATDPNDRYQTVLDLSDDLNRFQRGSEVSVRPDSLLRGIFRWIFDHQAIAGSTFTVVLLSMVIFIGLTLITTEQEKTAEKESQLNALNFQSHIEKKAYSIDREFTRLGGILDRFSDRLVLALEGPEMNHQPNIFDSSRFKLGPTAIDGLITSDTYTYPIHTKSANYNLPKDTPIPNSYLNKLQPVVPDMGRLLSASITSKNMSNAHDRLSHEGYPLRWLYVGFSNGLLINYPGTGILNGDYDPRTRPWYKKGQGSTEVVWSEPYIDAFGQGLVISASKNLLDRSGQFIGVVAQDVTLLFTQNLMRNTMGGIGQSYIVDVSGTVFVQSNTDEPKLHKLPYKNIKTLLRANKVGQIEIDGKLIGFSIIPSLGLFLVGEK